MLSAYCIEIFHAYFFICNCAPFLAKFTDFLTIFTFQFFLPSLF